MPNHRTAPDFHRLEAAVLEGIVISVRHRQHQLHQLQTKLVDSKPAILQALKKDHKRTDSEALLEYSCVLSELRQQYDGLSLEQENAKQDIINPSKDNTSRTHNLGIVYIIPGTHTVFYSTLSPLLAAIAAGNCVMIELPQTTIQIISLLRSILIETLGSDTLAITKTRASVAFLQGCTVVNQSSEKLNLTQRSLTSSTSSRNIAIIDRTANIKMAAQSLASASFSFAGKAPYAPDLVLVHDAVASTFAKHLIQNMASTFDAQGNNQSSTTRRSKTSGRQSTEQAQPSNDLRVLTSSSRGTVVEINSRNKKLLSKKIKNRMLVLSSVSSLDDAIDLANNSGTISASYIFAAPSEANYVSNFVDAQLSCVNHIPVELQLGPIAPEGFVPSLSPRYTRSMFEEVRPQIHTPSSLNNLVSSLNGELSGSRKYQTWATELEQPLKPTSQTDEKQSAFFSPSLFTGTEVSGLTIALGVGLAASYVFPRLRSA